MLYRQGQLVEALRLAEQSLAIYHDLGLSAEMGTTHTLISVVCTTLGQIERAAAEAHTALALHQQHPSALADDYAALGFALRAQSRDQEAEEALRLSAELDEQRGRSTGAGVVSLLGHCLVPPR